MPINSPSLSHSCHIFNQYLPYLLLLSIIGRNILPHAALREIGFEVYAIGKPEQNPKRF